MNIVFSRNFEIELRAILKFIAKDSFENAVKFEKNLYKEIVKIPFMPYRFRKNFDLNREDVRDLIFKGYIIPFKITTKNIEILTIFKQNLPKYK
ncbi:putative toxin-antitoxin system, toxin component, RelE/ParE family [Campylobacter ureolyticus RIGS 9880]|uniref:Toxin-antitoxin system, toxin component, RelE/ParE family n=1 Tax=Campylobacter ureolyticus RIGS 9880 TaxID=1032069 RepID=A0AAU8U8T4_9BACT|nr:type II toxin-antitoxin system RelE/ParE family toxin [Campylobacter ureolyticus]AKT90059.1 putative toxin-antitoxin system, toxin component, RelE/ParE family [Campylobacter ureolyticus RIGS 9880]MCZ6150043.1 type II toxin-antitoxin system RelE/ParE family toxin [Campylobacter ureolyticus]MCZ6157199.1 type II toxin-antitoxin system RelE/ParE family toxin [Campylobacter ureolyticus]MDU5325999.1 type II toxin-antitoxin system RelE/ParE family toxin [Campylobacter ureolyticus]GKH59832.1 hypoth